MVKRYGFSCDTYFEPCEHEDGDGQYVRFEDYAVLEAEVARLNKRLDDLYSAGVESINYVAAANYQSRHDEALIRFDEAYTPEPSTQD